MTNPVRAYLDKKGDRLYVGLDKRRRNKSVTTFMKVLPKPWLGPWIAKCVAGLATEVMMDAEDNGFYGDWCGAQFPNSPAILANYCDLETGEMDYDLLASDFALASDWERDDAGDVGDEVHELCELILTRSRGGHLQALAAFDYATSGSFSWSLEAVSRASSMLGFLKNHIVEVVAVEPTIYNDSLEYAGSADFIARIDGVMCIVDIKTSRTWGDNFAVQVSAYANGEYYLTDLDDTKYEIPTIEGGAVLWIEPDRCRLIEIDISPDTFDVFRACQTLTEKWVNLPKTKKTIFDSKEV
jgi:hypothetical protein